MSTESEIQLYSQEDIKQMQIADAARMPGKDRIEEIRSYAQKMGVKTIGIAHCVAVQKEAEQLKDMLSNDFTVALVGCKHGKISSSSILGNDAKGISCNPAGQAQYLAEHKTELNIVMGLCIGHDMIFSAKSTAPTTTLLVKDRAHANNTMANFQH